MFFFLYLFIFLFIFLIFCGLFLILSFNPVQAFIWFILLVCLYCFNLIFVGIEFLALLFLIVYVGAIIILHLFVVMMLNIRNLELSTVTYFFLSVSFAIFFLLAAFSFLFCFINFFDLIFMKKPFKFFLDFWVLFNYSNIFVFGNYLFEFYFIFFLVATLLLLFAMLSIIIVLLVYDPSNKMKEFNVGFMSIQVFYFVFFKL